VELEELFVPIPHWEPYAVSNYGRVIDLVGEYELNQRPNKFTGRMEVRLRYFGAYGDHYVDELVTEAFFVNYRHGIPIFYKNGNKSDCTVLNLSFDPKYGEENARTV
jgi:hypothetical protein